MKAKFHSVRGCLSFFSWTFKYSSKISEQINNSPNKQEERRAVAGPGGDQILLLDSEDSTSRINSECEEEHTQEAADQDTTLLIKPRCKMWG